jgi:hypothetical protein
MKSVHQHPDGMVFVRVDGATYGDTPDNFLSDFGFLLPELPEGVNERIYDQGRRHIFAGRTDDGAVIIANAMPWPLGDNAILNIEAGLSAQTTRKVAEEAARKAAEKAAHEAAMPPLPPMKPGPTQRDLVAFDHENRLRALEGKPAISASDFFIGKKI